MNVLSDVCTVRPSLQHWDLLEIMCMLAFKSSRVLWKVNVYAIDV